MPGQSFAERIPNLAGAAAELRDRFGGKITYAAAPWEEIDWAPFDFVAADSYRDAANRDHFAGVIRRLFRHGKPVAITEFGCCAYPGAADRGGLGWAFIDWEADPSVLDGDYVKDEGEQVRYLSELLEDFSRAGVDSAFWFSSPCTFCPCTRPGAVASEAGSHRAGLR